MSSDDQYDPYSLFFQILNLPESCRSMEQFISLLATAMRDNPVLREERDTMNALKQYERSHAQAHGLALVERLERRHFRATGSLAAAARLILAYAGHEQSASIVGQIIATQSAARVGLTQDERDAMLVHALGFFAYGAAVPTPHAATACDRSYEWPRLVGYSLALRLRSFQLSTLDLAFGPAVDEHKAIRAGQRYTEEHELTGYSGSDGRPFPAKLKLMDLDAAYQAGCTNPLLALGLTAKRIGQYFPMLTEWANALAAKPHDTYLILGVVQELRNLEAKGFDTREEQEGLCFLAAELGNKQALLESAMYAGRRGYHGGSAELLKYALSALLVAAGCREGPKSTGFENSARDAVKAVTREVELMFKSERHKQSEPDDQYDDDDAVAEDVDAACDSEEELAQEADTIADVVESEGGEEETCGTVNSLPKHIENRQKSKGIAEGMIRVIAEFGNPGAGRELKPLLEALKPLTQPLPLRPMPNDLGHWRQTLLGEFPHCEAAIAAFHDDLFQRQAQQKSGFLVRPTLLVGPPGTGKSRLARRLAELSGLAYRAFNAGGVFDGHFAGVSRGWSTAHPSLPLDAMRESKSPNPLILVDEVEKASTDRRNGALVDALLGMLESETAMGWFDPFVQTGVNLSGVCWIFTANSMEQLPGPFRDRVRVINIGRPSLEHLPQLAKSVLRELAPVAGVSDWAPPLSQEELDAVGEVWAESRSIRGLQRLLEGVLKARDLASARH